MKTPPKCIDCIHYQPQIRTTLEPEVEYAKCNAPQNINPAGARTWDFCATMRDMCGIEAVIFKGCGYRGRWFEAEEKS
jgi:hypothetical protein